MSITWWFPLALVIVGAVVWAIASGKPSEAGKIAFAVGMLVLTLALASAQLLVRVH